MKKLAIFIILFVVLAAAGCTVNDVPEDAPDPAGTETDAQIYAAAIWQIYTVDHSFGSPPNWPLIYLVSATDDSAMVDGPVSPSQQLPEDLQQAITAELADLPAEILWVDSFDEAPIDSSNGQVADGEGIIITLGNIHPQEDDSVQLSFFMTCGGLCGIGKVYVLNQSGGAWQVTGSVGPEIMS